MAKERETKDTEEFQDLLLQGRKKGGMLTYEEINAALAPEEVDAERIEDLLNTLHEEGIRTEGERDAPEWSDTGRALRPAVVTPPEDDSGPSPRIQFDCTCGTSDASLCFLRKKRFNWRSDSKSRVY